VAAEVGAVASAAGRGGASAVLLGGEPPLEEGERRVLRVRAHAWSLIRPALPLPLLALLPLPYTALDVAAPDLRLATFFPLFIEILGVALVVYLAKWVFMDLLPWLATVYVLTDRRVIAQSGVLSVRRRECSLLKVEESDYRSRGVAARLLDIGDVEVETLGRMGRIVLRDVPRPRRLQGLLSAEVRALREQSALRRQSEAPNRVARQLDQAIHGAVSKHNEDTEEYRPITPAMLRAQKRLNLLPGEAVVEVVRGHPILLVLGLLGPLLGVFLVIAVVAVLGLAFLPLGVAVVTLVLSPWAVWRVLGHLSHEYVLTTDRLMELRSSPFLYETRDVIDLTSVQDIALEIPTFFGRIADIGDVVVEVAGPSERVALKSIGRPAELQKRVFETIDKRRCQQREKEDERLISTLGQWFQEYHKLQQGSD